jgi:predicted RNA polymerase sigma factor
MLQAYVDHVAERAALGIPPLPLTAKQTAEVIELMKTATSKDGEFLLNLITYRVPAGVDDAAKVKASYLAAVAHGTEKTLLLTRARGDARTDADGRLVLMSDQDRSRWIRSDIEEGLDLITAVLRSGTDAARSPGRVTVQAVIAGLHVNAPSFAETDWPQLVRWYDALLRRWPTPVVRLNALVARSHLPQVDRRAVLLELQALGREPLLSRYPYLPAAEAELRMR